MSIDSFLQENSSGNGCVWFGQEASRVKDISFNKEDSGCSRQEVSEPNRKDFTQRRLLKAIIVC